MSEDDPLIGRYCGTQVPTPITSTSNVLYVRFVADYTVHKAGFNATYQQQDGEDLSITCTFCILKVQGQVSVIFIKKKTCQNANCNLVSTIITKRPGHAMLLIDILSVLKTF